MADPEERGLEKHSQPAGSRQGSELPLEVASEDQLLRGPGADRERDPEQGLDSPARQEGPDGHRGGERRHGRMLMRRAGAFDHLSLEDGADQRQAE